MERKTYPNPATGSAFVSWTQPAETSARLEIRTVTGQIVHSRELPAGTRRAAFDVSGWPAGVYLVKTRSADGILNAAQKLVVTD